MTTRLTGIAVVAACLPALCATAEMVTRRWGTPPAGPPSAKAAVPRAKPPTCYVPRAAAPPKIDGVLDDDAWKALPTCRLARTLDGTGPAPQPTEVRLRRDARKLYLAFRCAEPLSDRMTVSKRSHDGAVWDDDSIEFFLGPAGGGYFHFGVNAVGSTYDARGKDRSWNSRLTAASGREAGAWTLEVAVELKALAPQGKPPAAWSANFNRNRRATGRWQETAWSPTYSGDSHVPGRFGRMLFRDRPAPRPGEKPAAPAAAKQAVTVVPAAGGAGVVRFDLSDLPKGARVHRADLLVWRTVRIDGRMDESRVDIEIYPLNARAEAGAKPPVGSTPPLKLRGPWFDRLDATEAVRAWAAGKPNGGFFVKACPFWNAGATCLDVAYEGKPKDLPPQVTHLEAFHRAGQTFLTWREIDEPVGRDGIAWGQLKAVLDGLDAKRRVRYCVYRHAEPITAANVHAAELIARVRPLSCWNVTGRNVDRPVDEFLASGKVLMTGHWDPFRNATPDGQYGRDCPVDRLVIRDGQAPLPRGTGLYVHTAAGKQKAFYAVVTCVDGVENAGAITKANALAEPVAETPAEPEPVCQGELPRGTLFDYDQKRLHYVRWVSPPMANVPVQVHNWSVGVPSRRGKAVGLELSLHRDGHSYWRTQYRLERDSVVLCPYDFPVKTWWHGCHEAVGTLRAFRAGAIHPYTERRLLSFVAWACRTWPVDRARAVVTGCRGGAAGSGALRLGLRHPEVFSLVVAGHPVIDYADASRRTDRHGLADALSMQAVWGKADWRLPAPGGASFWDAHDMNRFVAGKPPAAEMPFLALTSNHGNAAFRRLYEHLLGRRTGLLAEFSWGGTRYLCVSRSQTTPNVIRLDIAADRPYLAVVSPEGLARVREGKMGDLNLQFRWRDVRHEPGRLEATIFLGGRGEAVANVTPRRLRKFRPAAGKTYTWKVLGADGKTEAQSGEATADAAGLLTLSAVRFDAAPRRLVVTPK